MNTMIDDDSFFVIEEMMDSFRNAPERSKMVGPMDSHRRPYIVRVHIVGFSSMGVYICRDFGNFPHYMIDRDKIQSQVLDKCRDWKKPIKLHSSKKQLSRSKIMCVWQLGEEVAPGNITGDNDDPTETEPLLDSDSIRAMLGHLHSLNFDSIDIKKPGGHGARYMDEDIAGRLRGAKQVHMGYTSNYSLKRVVEEGQVSVQPQLIGGKVPQEWKERFVALTKIGDLLFDHATSICLRGVNNKRKLYGDDQRTKRFANKIHNDNRVEALTYSVTSSPGKLLKIHLDVNNDETETGKDQNYNYILCGWITKRETAESPKKREAMLGYSRRSLSDLLTREDRCIRFCNDHMSPWLEKMPPWRINVNPTTKIFDKEFYGEFAKLDADNNMSFPPTLNKHATFMSGFVDQILRLKIAYESASKKQMTVEKQLEVILPLVFFPSADIFRTIIQEWIDRPGFLAEEATSSNLTMVYIADATQLKGAVNKGGHFPRHQPTFNVVPDKEWVTTSLVIMRKAVIQAGKKKKAFTYNCMTVQISKIKHVGPLLTQHLIHAMALTGLIDPMFGAKAEICDGTMAAKRILELHSIPKSSHPCLLEFVCSRYSWLPYLAENGICKSGQKKLCQFKDVIYGSQQHIYWVIQDDMGAFRIAYLNRDWSNNKHRREIRHKVQSAFLSDNLIFEEVQEGFIPSSELLNDKQDVFWWLPHGTTKALRADIDEKYYDTEDDEFIQSVDKRQPCRVDTSPRKKRRKSRTTNLDELVPSPPPVPSPPNWTTLDQRTMQEMVSAYEKEVKRNVLLKSSKYSQSKEEYGEGLSTNSLALRTVHSVGKHFVAPSRSANTTISTESLSCGDSHLIFGSTKIPAHLLSMGVEVVSWNMHRLAEKLLVKSYRADQASLSSTASENIVLKVAVVPVRARVLGSPRGRTYFVGRGQLCKIVSANVDCSGLKRKTEAEVITQFFIRSGTFGQDSSGILYEGIVRGDLYSSDVLTDKCLFTTAYTTTAQASNSMLWYIIWTNSQCRDWLPEMCPVDKWRSTKSVANVGNETVGMIEYMLVSLHNGKGKVFCTLVRQVGKRIWMRIEMETRTKESGVWNTPIFQLCDTDPIAHIARLSSAVANPPSCHKVFHNEQASEIEEPVMLAKQAALDAKEKERESRTLERIPLLVDPIDFNNKAEFASMDEDLHRWKTFWGEQLHSWKSTMVARGKGKHADKYWQPPGFPSTFHGIRSKPDLRLFLDNCSQLVHGADNSLEDENNCVVDYTSAVESFMNLKPRPKSK